MTETSAFYEVEQSDAAAMVDLATAEILAEPDPSTRYVLATKQQQLYTAVVDAIASIRDGAVIELHRDGLSYARIADQLGINRSLAQKLVERGRGR